MKCLYTVGILVLCLALAGSLSLTSCSREEPRSAAGPGAKELAAHTAEFRKELIKVTEGVYVAVGYGLANSILLVGKEGTVVVDVMESMEAARPVKRDFDRITKKPLRAVIYTHYHADHVFGAGAFAGNKTVDVYSHAKTLEELDQVTAVTQEITYKRAMRMFGTFLPKGELENCGIGPRLEFNDKTTISYIRPNKIFTGERMKVRLAGMSMELIHAPGETDDQIVVWIPEKRVLIAADDFYKSFPNLYTIRGTKYRDVMLWAKSLEKMRCLHAAFLIPCHSRPITGAKRIDGVLSDYRDAIHYVHDQTVRGINRGLTPDQLVQTVKLPTHLAEKPYLREYYGTVAWSVRNIFNGYLGWFSGNAADLYPPPPRERAERFARLAGGNRALLDHARRALAEGDLPWALQLADQALVLTPELGGALEVRAACLRALGRREGNANARNYCLTQALEAEGKLKLTRANVDRATAHRVPLAAVFAGMAVRLNPEKSAGVTRSAAFRFPDTKEAWTVHVRRGVAFIEPRLAEKADITVTVSSLLWKEIATKLTNPAVAMAKGDLKVEGGIASLVKFLYLFMD